MPVTFVKGQMMEYTATRDFALNFEDRKLASQKVKKDSALLYDGDVATYENIKGETISGRCPSLKSAINVMGWLVPNGQEPVDTQQSSEPALVVGKVSGDYNAVKGGSFDTYANQQHDIHVAPNPAHFKKMEVTKESEMIVRTITSPRQEKPVKSNKLEVAGDQVEVKKGFTVNSSTSITKENKRKMEVIPADEMGSEGSMPITMVDKKTGLPKKKNTYIVDERTPAIPAEDVTLRDIKKITKTAAGTNVIHVEESQDAMVVGTIDMSKGRKDVQEIEGITLRKPKPSSKDPITLTKVKSPSEMTVKTTVTGSGHVADVQTEGAVVQEKTPEEKAALAKAAAARAASRKASAVQTEKEVLKGRTKEPRKDQKDFDPLKGGSFDTALAQDAINVSVAPSAADLPQAEVAEKDPEGPIVATKKAEEEPDYLSMLPADWGTMHWVKKEKYIKSLTDVAFIKFVMSMETIKAVQNACNERLKELEKGTAG